MTTTRPAAGPRTPSPAGRRAWIGLAVLALPALLASLELTVTHLALPAIGRDLPATGTQLLWIADVYAFLLAGSLLATGTLGDRFGRRRLLLAGAAAYGVASVAAAYAPDAGTLIVTRALMGVAGSTLMPSTLALAATMFPDSRRRATAISVIIASVSAGTALGPLVGGWLLDRFWWGSAFLLAVPVMAVLLVAGPLLLPEHRERRAARPDLLSAALSVAAVLAVVYGLKQIAAGGPAWPPAGFLLAGAAAGALFARRQRRLAVPMLDLRLFAGRTFGIALLTLGLGIFVLWGANYAVAQYLQLVHGLTPFSAGLWTAPSAAGVIAGSLLSGRIARRVPPARVIAGGLALSAAGFAVLAQAGPAGGLGVLVTGSVVVSAGLGPMMALATDMVVGAAPPERRGEASALSSAAPQLGGALGIAVLGSVIAAVYRAEMASAVPGGVPAATAALARDSLAGASAAAGTLPGGGALLAAAREAFSHGFHVTAWISAAVVAVLAVLVVRLAVRR